MASSNANENVGVALALVFGAGASTGIGAAVVFIPSLVKIASRRVLASSLGFSAGVMTYVSFIEIFNKSADSFEAAGYEENKAYIYATLCFFGGVVVMLLLNAVVGMLLGKHSHRHHDDFPNKTKKSTRESVNKQLTDFVEGSPPCCGTDPVKQLDTVQRMGSVLQHEMEDDAQHATGESDSPEDNGNPVPDESLQIKKKVEIVEEDSVLSAEIVETIGKNDEHKRLHKMGLNTALAIGLHNFPEGLATFAAALQDPKVGAILAVAIAIHNIPEGLCVALPIYYASGNRFKGFMWALLSGASEFVAALLGWAILANTFTESAYAILFGLVAGMMVMISTRELLPTAHLYDSEDTVVSYSFIAGMIVMALSLCLFQI